MSTAKLLPRLELMSLLRIQWGAGRLHKDLKLRIHFQMNNLQYVCSAIGGAIKLPWQSRSLSQFHKLIYSQKITDQSKVLMQCSEAIQSEKCWRYGKWRMKLDAFQSEFEFGANEFRDSSCYNYQHHVFTSNEVTLHGWNRLKTVAFAASKIFILYWGSLSTQTRKRTLIRFYVHFYGNHEFITELVPEDIEFGVGFWIARSVLKLRKIIWNMIGKTKRCLLA